MEHFVAFLRGSEQTPPVQTEASGRAFFELSADRTQLNFRLIITNIRNMTAAHIHLGARGQEGPVVAPMFMAPGPGVTAADFVETGTITRSDLTGPLAGRPFSALLTEMREGNTYVNAHTVQHPDGEIRGQIRHTDLTVYGNSHDKR